MIDARFINPLNYEPILESVSKTGKVLLTSDACERGSFLHTMASNITQLAFDYLDGPPVVVGSAQLDHAGRRAGGRLLPPEVVDPRRDARAPAAAPRPQARDRPEPGGAAAPQPARRVGTRKGIFFGPPLELRGNVLLLAQE